MALFQRTDRFRDLRNSPRHDVQYLAIGEQHQVPDEFTLLLRRRCRVVRRDDGQLGVQFV